MMKSLPIDIWNNIVGNLFSVYDFGSFDCSISGTDRIEFLKNISRDTFVFHSNVIRATKKGHSRLLKWIILRKIQLHTLMIDRPLPSNLKVSKICSVEIHCSICSPSHTPTESEIISIIHNCPKIQNLYISAGHVVLIL